MEEAPPLNGYTKLASLIGAKPELAIFRRFGSLNAKNLLYLQAELVHLEQELARSAKADAESGDDERKIYDRHWKSLAQSGFTPGGNSKQWTIALQIRKTLREYNEALLLQSLLATQEGPLARDLEFLKDWMEKPSRGFVYLLGDDRNVWEKSDATELIALKRYDGHTLVTRSVGDFLVYWWDRCVGKRRRKAAKNMYGDTIEYSDSTLAKVTMLFGTALASTLPVLAILVLYFVRDMGRRLAIIAVFTPLFSAAISIFTNGKGIEIFTATAGFAAVQVVFVGTTSSISG